MRGPFLFARSRRWGPNFGVVAASAFAILICGPVGYSLNPQGGYLVAVAAQLPLLSAIAIQASLDSPLTRAERYTARRLSRGYLLHVVALTCVAAVCLGLAATQLKPPPDALLDGMAPVGPVAMIRNLLALGGAAFVGAAAFGSSLGWILPLSWATLPLLALPTLDADPSGLLTLVAQPDDALLPFASALVAWWVGLVIATRRWDTSRSR